MTRTEYEVSVSPESRHAPLCSFCPSRKHAVVRVVIRDGEQGTIKRVWHACEEHRDQ